MKVLLISSLGALLLTGCDNFQLQKPMAGIKVPGITILQNDGVPPGTNLPQSTDDSGSKDKPANNSDSNQETPVATTAAPVSTAPSTNTPATASAPEAAPAATPAINFPEPAAPAAADKDATNSPKPTATETTSGTKTTTATDGQPSVAAVTKKAGEAAATPVPATPEKKTTPPATSPAPTAGSETGTTPETKKKTETPATPPAQAATPTTPAPEAKPATPPSPNLMTIVEYINLQTVMNITFGEKVRDMLLKRLLPDGIEKDDVKIDFSGTYNKFSYKVSIKDKLIAEFKDVKLKLNAFNSYAENGYEMVAACSGAKCDMMFASILKFDSERKILANFPMIFKLVDGKYMKAAFKTSDEYSADRNTLPDPRNLPLVPQILVTQKLQLFLDANGPKLIESIKKQLADDESLAYSDAVLNQPTMKKNEFHPEFSREDGKLVLSAQVQYSGPRKPIPFKTVVTNESNGTVVQSDTGLSLTLVPRIKDQVYVVIMTQQRFTSKIAKVNKAEQVLVCALVEEEKNQFTECEVIPAALIFQAEDVIEGNSKEQIKATK